MKRTLCLLVALVLALAIMPIAGAEEPPTLEEQIEDSVVLGLDWLAGQANPDGSFSYWHTIAHTGLVVLKFEDRAIDLGLDPLSEEYEYHAVVQAGLDNIETHAVTQPIGVEPAGNPDGNGNGIGIHWSEDGTPSIYATGIAMMALAASQHPELYGVLLQDAVDYMAWAQVDEGCSGSEAVHRGGWRYGPNQCTSDNSTSGYATLGMGFAGAAPPFGFGLTVPEFVVDELDPWIGVIQDPVDGDDQDGGSYYDPQWPDYVNILKTGNLLYEMGLVGDTASAARVRDAVDYIERMWTSADPDVGWIGHRQAMFTMMKGLESLGIELLDLDGVEPLDEWFPIVAQHLIDTQNPDGSWPYDYFGDEILSTAWALLTLEKAVPTFEVPVPVDIKPTSCRNPLNVKAKGVLPVAVLGTEDFDVAQIDPASVTLMAVAPFRWATEDVATPYVPYLGKEGAYDCTTDGPDGFMDLSFKFKTQEVVAAFGAVADGDVLIVPLTGNLMEEFGGTPIVGEDVIVVLRKDKP
jgi:hypothetical protein